ncbi:MAG: CoB--CoM heterodisulfide reductase iron-sulfur subunit A family protein [Thermoplasmata archaeon]|nr:CoB--CoM heterodisulfide reductase iron-sulfur subunit A family protein [Thermoplasmata archaeon]
MAASDKIGAVMVVGGGIAGMQASLDLADSGYKVYLVEKQASIGGTMAQLDKTFPTNDCAMCIMAPKLVATGRHHNIDLITNAEIAIVDGDAGNFTVTVKQHSFRVDPKKCTGCGSCAQKCPVEWTNEYDEGTKMRKAIYVRYPQAVPLVYSIDPERCIGCGICAEECKAKAVEYDQKDKVLEVKVGSIILTPGFDEFNARLKTEYGYGVYQNVVTSIEFERIMSATGPYFGTILRPSDGDIPAKVAFIQCVGSRDEHCGNEYCSSVCCMYAIKEAAIAKEHTSQVNPTIFFMDMRAFGKEFDEYYNRAQNEWGIKFVRSRIAAVTENPKTKNLILKYVANGEPKEEEFNMVVLSVGLRPPVDNETLSRVMKFRLNDDGFAQTGAFSPVETSRPGIYVAGAFSAPKDIPMTVAEASGAAAKAGSVISSARNTLITKKEYPKEMSVEGQDARIGVFVCHCGVNIGGVVKVPEVMEYAKTLPNVVYAEQNLYTCSQDAQERIKEKIKEHKLNRVVVASCTPRTHEPLFQNTIREAGLNAYLFEMANIRDQCSWIHMHEPKAATKKSKDLVRMAVAKSRLLEPLQNLTMKVNQSALVVGGGVAGMTAALEIAKQGYKVHLVEKEKELGGVAKKLYYLPSGDDPLAYVRRLDKEVTSNKNITVYTGAKIRLIDGYVGNFKTSLESGEEIEHGIVILAIGGQEYKPEGEYLYGKNKSVMTLLELKERLHKGDPLGKEYVFIQCVGSREKGHPNCSRVCCTGTMTAAIEIKKKDPKAKVYVLYRDIRTYGFREKYYKEAGNLGVTFIRFDDEVKPKVEEKGGKLEVKVMDEDTGKEIMLRPEYLVLASGTRPQPDAGTLAPMCKVPQTKEGFFLEAHMKLRPVDFATEGIYVAGLAHGPKFLDESIAQSLAAVARATTVLSKTELEAEGIVARIDEDLCDGCGICVPTCEYKALEVVAGKKDPKKKLVEVNVGLCKGCGACVGSCPAGALTQMGYRDSQITAMIDAALEGQMPAKKEVKQNEH